MIEVLQPVQIVQVQQMDACSPLISRCTGPCGRGVARGLEGGSEPLAKRARKRLASSMVTGSTFPVRLCLRLLMNVSVVAVTSVMLPFSHMRYRCSGPASRRSRAAGHGGVETPEAVAALRKGGRDGPILKELGAIVEDAAEASFVDELLASMTAGRAGRCTSMFRTPAASTAWTMPSVSAALRLSGFSQLTILPALAAAMAISAWVLLGLTYRSDRYPEIRRPYANRSRRLVSPFGGEVLGQGRVDAADGLENGSYGNVEKW